MHSLITVLVFILLLFNPIETFSILQKRQGRSLAYTVTILY
jgi:hypothetical protein